MALLAASMPVLLNATPASASTPDPSGVSFTLEGCRNNGTITLPNAGGQYVCPTPAYTTGNLGTGWNELDLVPHRITAKAGNSAPASQTYAVAIAADNCIKSGTVTGFKCADGTDGFPGYDTMSAPQLNASLSAASCTALQSSGTQVKVPGVGGTDVSLYEILTISQAANTTCVYDYYERLALGSHLFPGSSLHSNLLNQSLGTAGIGARDVSIPVKGILPQSLSKDMSASQGSDHIWNLTKQASPATLNFSNTCDTTAGATSAGVTVTVGWQKLAATPSGDITVLTHVYATNPAARTITVNVTDTVYDGSNTALHVTAAAPVNVPANTTTLVLTDTLTVPSGTSGLHDIATASYTDLVTGVPVPGQTSATASATVQSSGSASNDTATVSDSESITGANLSFSVDSVTGATGSFAGGYTLGTQTTGPVVWNSDSQSGSGSVVFHKTVSVGAPSIETGTLSDTATLTGSDGFTTTASAQTDISVDATVSLTIDKTIPVVLGAGDTPQTFTFDVTGSALPAVLHPTITFNTGDGGAVAKSTALTGLPPSASAADPYTITEEPAAPYAPTLPQTAAIVLPSCSGSVTFTNSFGPATAEVQKITNPAGSEAGWVFTLTGPNTPAGGEVVTTTGTAPVSFSTALGEGSYTVTEAPQTGWDNTGVTETTLGSGTVNDQTAAHQCTFSVNYPADADHVFSCAFTNTQRGRVRVVKTVGGLPLSGTQSFTFTLQQGTTTATAGTVLETQVANAANGGTINFATLLVPGATYQMCETVAVGWLTSLGPGLFTGFNGSDNSLQCVNFSVTPGQTLTFTVDNTPPPGGQARTIGYWKNWASCSTSKGKQTFVLDQTLASFPNQGVTVGVEFVNTCQLAVALLNKSDYRTGKKMASDPAYNLAAQLLAADLNIQAGAASCTAANTAIAAAQSLLVAINFTGTGAYAAHMTPAQITQANSLATTLDQYNNNLLC